MLYIEGGLSEICMLTKCEYTLKYDRKSTLFEKIIQTSYRLESRSEKEVSHAHHLVASSTRSFGKRAGKKRKESGSFMPESNILKTAGLAIAFSILTININF